MDLDKQEIERWSIAKQIINNWWPPLKPEDGLNIQEIREAEEKMQLNLPVAMKEWYLLASKRRDFFDNLTNFNFPNNLFVIDNILEVCTEAEAVYHWGIKLADLQLEDPPVYTTDHDYTIDAYLVGSYSFFVTNLLAYLTPIKLPGYKATFTFSTQEPGKLLKDFIYVGYSEVWPLNKEQIFYNENGFVILDMEAQTLEIYAQDIKKFESCTSLLGIEKGKLRLVESYWQLVPVVNL